MMDSLRAPWSFCIVTDLATVEGCSAVVLLALACFLSSLGLSWCRVAQTEIKLPADSSATAGDVQNPAVVSAKDGKEGTGTGDVETALLTRTFKGHVQDRPEYNVSAQAIYEAEVRCGFTFAKSLLAAPFSCPYYLNQRLQSTTVPNLCALWLQPCMLIASVLIVLLWMPFTRSEDVSMLVCAPLVVVIIFILCLAMKLQGDPELANIDNFMEHRQIHRLSFQNLLSLASISYSFCTCCGLSAGLLPIQSNPDPSSYESAKAKVKSVLEVVGFINVDLSLLSVEWLEANSFLLSFVVAVAVACTWSVFYHPFIHAAMRKSAEQATCHWRKKASLIGSRMHLYEIIAQHRRYIASFPLISETLFIPVLTNIMRALHCVKSESVVGGLVLHAAPQIECWAPPHMLMALVAIISIFMFIPTCIFGAPFMIADSDGIVCGKSSDILMRPTFLVLQTTLKVILSVVSVFIGRLSASWAITSQFVVNLFMAYCVLTMKPCSVLWINYLYVSILSCSCWFSLQVLFDINTDVEWWPFVYFVVGIAVAVALLGSKLRALCKIGGYPKLEYSPMSGCTHPDTMSFDEISMLTGVHHRLKQMTFWVGEVDGAEVTCGVECVYEVDGVIIYGSPHLMSGMDEHFEKVSVVLEPAEWLIELGTCDASVTVKTNKRVIHISGNGKHYDRMQVANFEDKISEGYQAVGIYGGIGGGMHYIGAILQQTRAT